MARGCWIAGVVLSGALLLGTEAAAATLDAPAVRVKVFNVVGMPEDTLRQAQLEASRIFEKAGINLIWIPAQEPSAGSLILKIVATPRGINNDPAVLGIAVGSKKRGRIAYLFYDRIDQMRGLFGLDASKMLGYVTAHEMGHLLLGYGSHSAAGIMKRGWDRNQTVDALNGSLAFYPDQVKRILTRLQDAN